MRRLSGWDTIHLQIETSRQVSNVLGLVHLERVPDSVSSVTELKQSIQEAVAALAPLRQMVKQVPWDPDLPVWVDCPNFRVQDHVVSHEVSGFDEVRRWAELLAAARLDRKKPLWAVHIFRDRVGGDLYVIWLMHHCAIDAPLGKSMLALVSGGVDASTAEAIVEYFKDSQMAHSGIVRDGVRCRTRKLRRLPQLLWATVAMFRDWVSRSRRGAALPHPFTGKRTGFNVTMDGTRRLGFMQVELANLQYAAKRLGCTVNDILLTALGGAIRREVLRRGGSVGSFLTVMQPNIVDYNDDEFVTDGANTVSAMIARLRIDIEDPLDRLHATREETLVCKQHHSSIGMNWARAWSEYTVPFILPSIVRFLEAVRVSEWTPPIFNVLCANVDGTDIPAVFFGHEIQALYPVGALYHGTGLSISAWSTGSFLNISFLTSGSSKLDPEHFVAEMRSQFDLLLDDHRR